VCRGGSVIGGAVRQLSVVTASGAQPSDKAVVEEDVEGMGKLNVEVEVPPDIRAKVHQLWYKRIVGRALALIGEENMDGHRLTGLKLLCAEPNTGEQCLHADHPLGATMEGRSLSLLVTLSDDAAASTVLPCFPYRVLEYSAESLPNGRKSVGARATMATRTINRELGKWFHRVDHMPPGCVIIMKQCVQHAGARHLLQRQLEDGEPQAPFLRRMGFDSLQVPLTHKQRRTLHLKASENSDNLQCFWWLHVSEVCGVYSDEHLRALCHANGGGNNPFRHARSTKDLMEQLEAIQQMRSDMEKKAIAQRPNIAAVQRLE